MNRIKNGIKYKVKKISKNNNFKLRETALEMGTVIFINRALKCQNAYDQALFAGAAAGMCASTLFFSTFIIELKKYIKKYEYLENYLQRMSFDKAIKYCDRKFSKTNINENNVSQLAGIEIVFGLLMLFATKFLKIDNYAEFINSIIIIFSSLLLVDGVNNIFKLLFLMKEMYYYQNKSKDLENVRNLKK